MQAFDAPLLQDVPSNLRGRRVARLVGAREVQYGILCEPKVNGQPSSLNPAEKLAVGDKSNICELSARHWYEMAKETTVERAARVQCRRQAKKNGEQC